MGDDLDSFFIKADKKKKKKGSSKIVAGDLLEQKKEEEARRLKKEEKKNKDKEQMATIMRKTKEDEDWDDFEDTQEVNFQNLRIANLAELRDKETLSPEKMGTTDEDHDKESDDDASQHSDDSSVKKGKKEKETVWGIKDSTTQDTSVQSTEDKKPAEPTASEKYVPPCRKEGGTTKIVARKNKTPDISNNTEFPTLGSEPVCEESVSPAEGWVTAQRTRTQNTSSFQPSVSPLTHSSNAYVPPGKRAQQDSSAAGTVSASNSDSASVGASSIANRDSTSKYVPPARRQKNDAAVASPFVSKNKFAGLESN